MRPTNLALPDHAVAYFHPYLGAQPAERVVIACLNGDFRPLRTIVSADGATVSHVDLCITDIVDAALACGARSIILAHNHPSGDPHASPEDIETTLKLEHALARHQKALLGHYILAARGVGLIIGDRWSQVYPGPLVEPQWEQLGESGIWHWRCWGYDESRFATPDMHAHPTYRSDRDAFLRELERAWR